MTSGRKANIDTVRNAFTATPYLLFLNQGMAISPASLSYPKNSTIGKIGRQAVIRVSAVSEHRRIPTPAGRLFPMPGVCEEETLHTAAS
jgi:hypothetical protein